MPVKQGVHQSIPHPTRRLVGNDVIHLILDRGITTQAIRVFAVSFVGLFFRLKNLQIQLKNITQGFSEQVNFRFKRCDYNSPWKCDESSPTPLIPWPEFNCKWLSMIWNNSGGCGSRPDSSFDQTGMLSTLISNAPVDTSWLSTALLTKKIIMQAYILFSIAQVNGLGVSMPSMGKGL